MKVLPEDLSRHLAKGLSRLYVIHGDAMLLALEAADSLRMAARAAGYGEREVLVVERGFNWADLRNAGQSQSLFSSRKLIELRIPGGKPGTDGALALQDYCQQLHADTVTLVMLPRLDSAAMKSKWFLALTGRAVMIPADEISPAALPAWIAERLKRQGQQADAETLVFLAEKVEGNLLAAFQEIQKLALLFPAGALSFEQVKDTVMDVARYNVSKLSEAMMLGDTPRFVHILEGLRAEGTAAVLVLWALTEEVRAVARVLSALQRGANLGVAMNDARVWNARQKGVEHAVRRFSLPMAERALRQAAALDKVVKGLRRGDAWDELLQLGVRCARTAAG